MKFAVCRVLSIGGLLAVASCSVFAQRWPDFPYVVYSEEAVSSVAGQVRFRPCRVEHPNGSLFRMLECGNLQVPENYAEPNGRKITLFIGRIKATEKRSKTDPLVPIAGGPGSAASESYLFPGQGFGKIARNRDIYIIDQRGTGKSGKLTCLEDLDKSVFKELEAGGQTARLFEMCLAELNAAPAQYTTSVAVKDLDAVRSALGVSQWNLYGASYGTRVAQHYLRSYPKHTRSVILDAVVAPQLNLPLEVASNSQRALDRLLQRCENDKACKSAFPDLRQNLDKLFAALEKKPIKVSVENISTGTLDDSSFQKADLQIFLRLSLYTSEFSAILPLLVHEAAIKNNYAPLIRNAQRTEDRLGSMLSLAMHNTVVCSEDMFFSSVNDELRQTMAATFMGEGFIDSLVEACSLWPKGPVDSTLKEFVSSDVPVLLLSGSEDPITPPRYAEMVHAKLDNSVHLIVQGHGHGMAAKGCVPSIMARFVESASVDNLNAVPFVSQPANNCSQATRRHNIESIGGFV